MRAPSLFELALAPLVWLCLLFQHFAGRHASLRKMRRVREARRDFREHWPGLRQSEWLMAQIIAEGARRLLAHADIGLDCIPCIAEPPEWFAPEGPRDALAMHRRMLALARFHADPIAVIRRRAHEIAAREGARDPLGNVIAPAARVADHAVHHDDDHDHAPGPDHHHCSVACIRVRAPP